MPILLLHRVIAATAAFLLASTVAFSQFPSMPSIDPPKLPKLPGFGDSKTGAKKGASPAKGDSASAAPAGARPQFAPLVTAECRAGVATLDEPLRSNVGAILDIAPATDKGPAPLQLAYGKTILQIAGLVGSSRQHGDENPLWGLSQALRPKLEELEAWIAGGKDRQGAELQFAAKGGGGRATGVRTIAWGPIKGWNDDVVRIKFDDEVVFERQSKAESLPFAMKMGFVPEQSEWGGDLPALDALPGSIDLFLSQRALDGVEGVTMTQKLLVVDGSLEAAVTVLMGKELLLSAKTQWGSVTKDLGADAEVVSLLRAEIPTFSFVTWRKDTGMVTALALNAMRDVDNAKFTLKSPEYEVDVLNCSSMAATDKVRGAVREWTFDLSGTTREQNEALVPPEGSMVLVLGINASGKDHSTLCSPQMALTDTDGKKYVEVGDHGRIAVLKGLRALAKDIPDDVSMLTLAKISNGMAEGIEETHGKRSRIFYVPTNAKGLQISLDSCDRTIALPDMPSGDVYARKPITFNVESKFDGSIPQTETDTVCIAVRQWSAGIVKRAATAAVAAKVSAAKAASDAAEASKKKAAEKDQKLQKSFD